MSIEPVSYRERDVETRTRLVKIYVTDTEYAELVATAATARFGKPVSVSRYAGEAAISSARRALTPVLDPLRDAILAVIMTRSAVNGGRERIEKATAALDRIGLARPEELADAMAAYGRADAAAADAMAELVKQVRLAYPRPRKGR
jgi:hypothetical protein